ncbi:MAG TPA: hypothetical protein DCM68_07415 [Verrucomicrobia bacterium]|nr:hypothetical protein [Verrucomicrobiota bacterium]
MNLASGIAPDWFPRAQQTDGQARPFPCGICEAPPSPPAAAFTERHLQCVWADDRLRPQMLATASGERVQVEHPGEWNTGPGPDFLNAALRVGPELRRLTGDVEIHIRPGDWQRHRHAEDPRYRHVCAHVAFYPGTLPDAELPAGALQIALRPALDALPDFSFDNIDLMAYPVAARATPPPCREAMSRLTPAQRGAALDAAGETRLRRRAELLQSAMLDRGPAQVIYEEVMAALGYRPNKAPFRRLARLLPLDRLREKSAGDPIRAYSLLMGCASLLPDPSSRRAWDDETKSFIRRCWDAWWPLSDEFLSRRIPRSNWTMAGIRPANRPERRLMAAALLFAASPSLPERIAAIAQNPQGVPADQLLGLFDLPDAPYWAKRLSFSSSPAKEPVTLVGKSRAQAILVNLLLPAFAAMGAPAEAWKSLLNTLPAEESNELIKQTALRLFGQDHTPRLYRSGLRRQGLIQIHHDYCLGDRSLCAACPFPKILKS